MWVKLIPCFSGTAGGSVDTRVLEEKLDRQGQLLMMQLESLRMAFKNSPTSSPTPSTLGKEQYATLMAAHRWNVVQGDGNPVLSSQQVEKLPATTCSESDLIQWFTPRLNRLVELASTQVDSPLVLVNSERHGWVEDPSPLGAPSKPDMFVCHPAFWKSIKSTGDTQYDSGNFRFGVLAHWDLRDCVNVIVEWKCTIGFGDFSALGEGVEYARRIMHTDDNSGVCLDKPMVRITRVILADREKFFLVLCQHGVAGECVWGKWTDAGSEGAIVDFIKSGTSGRRWVDAISSLCFQFKVTLVVNDNNPCFLGRGACGRVFRVRTVEHGSELALKVALDDLHCSAIREEFFNYERNKDTLAQLGCVVSISNVFTGPDRKYAGLLSNPVGFPCKMTKANIISAVMGLRVLALSGFQHGDARLPNVVIHKATQRAVWLDLRTLEFKQGDDLNSNTLSFNVDLKTFLDSLPRDSEKVYNQIVLEVDDFLRSGGEDHALIKVLSCLWD